METLSRDERFSFILSQRICMHCHLSPSEDEEHAEVGMSYKDIKSIVNNIITKILSVKYFYSFKKFQQPFQIL